jgi:hypothetical protein
MTARSNRNIRQTFTRQAGQETWVSKLRAASYNNFNLISKCRPLFLLSLSFTKLSDETSFLSTVIITLVVCNIQEDIKYLVPMCEIKMLAITHEVYITFGNHKLREIF